MFAIMGEFLFSLNLFANFFAKIFVGFGKGKIGIFNGCCEQAFINQVKCHNFIDVSGHIISIKDAFVARKNRFAKNTNDESG